jgi:hypothetical protein
MTTVSEVLTQSKVGEFAEDIAAMATDTASWEVERSTYWKELDLIDPEIAQDVLDLVKTYVEDEVCVELADRIGDAIQRRQEDRKGGSK